MAVDSVLGRLGSGDGERKTLLTRQIAFEPLPASVLLGLGCSVWLLWSDHAGDRWPVVVGGAADIRKSLR